MSFKDLDFFFWQDHGQDIQYMRDECTSAIKTGNKLKNNNKRCMIDWQKILCDRQIELSTDHSDWYTFKGYLEAWCMTMPWYLPIVTWILDFIFLL